MFPEPCHGVLFPAAKLLLSKPAMLAALTPPLYPCAQMPSKKRAGSHPLSTTTAHWNMRGWLASCGRRGWETVLTCEGSPSRSAWRTGHGTAYLGGLCQDDSNTKLHSISRAPPAPAPHTPMCGSALTGAQWLGAHPRGHGRSSVHRRSAKSRRLTHDAEHNIRQELRADSLRTEIGFRDLDLLCAETAPSVTATNGSAQGKP